VQARVYLTQAVDLCRASLSKVDLARALSGLGQIERDLHENDAALRHYEEALALYRAEDNPLKVAHTVRHVGDIHRHEKRHELAELCYVEALSLYRAHSETSALDLANAIRGMAILKDETGEAVNAKLLWAEARDLYRLAEVQAGVAECSKKLVRAPDQRL